MTAFGTLFFKRTLRAVTRALADPEPSVRAAALESLGRLHFTHAFDALARLYRDHADPAVRQVALRTIGLSASLEVRGLVQQYVEIEGNAETRRVLAGVLDRR